jgi:hypothetical protein
VNIACPAEVQKSSTVTGTKAVVISELHVTFRVREMRLSIVVKIKKE